MRYISEKGYVHYGDSTFKGDKFKSIENNDFSKKPDGGLWASSCKAKKSWDAWCVDNNFRMECLDKYFYFKIAAQQFCEDFKEEYLKKQ